MVSSILLLIIACGCFSVKPSSTKSGKKYFETFYVGDEGTQYFIKPISFKSEKSNEDAVLDFTFRYKSEIKDSAIVNFSIKSALIYKSIDSLKISNKNMEVKSDKIKLIFNEKKSSFISRFSTKLSVKEVKDLFNNNEWVLVLYSRSQTEKFSPHRKATKAISVLSDKVFILM